MSHIASYVTDIVSLSRRSALIHKHNNKCFYGKLRHNFFAKEGVEIKEEPMKRFWVPVFFPIQILFNVLRKIYIYW